MVESSITRVMEGYAEAAVVHAARLSVALDYSEASLEEVERILATYTSSGIVVPERLSPADEEDLWTLCKTYGGYVGEVIIRNLGGAWQMKPMESGKASISLVVRDGAAEGSPPEAVWRSLTEPSRPIVTFYQTLKVALGLGDEVVENGLRTVRLPPLSHEPRLEK